MHEGSSLNSLFEGRRERQGRKKKEMDKETKEDTSKKKNERGGERRERDVEC